MVGRKETARGNARNSRASTPAPVQLFLNVRDGELSRVLAEASKHGFALSQKLSVDVNNQPRPARWRPRPATPYVAPAAALAAQPGEHSRYRSLRLVFDVLIAVLAAGTSIRESQTAVPSEKPVRHRSAHGRGQRRLVDPSVRGFCQRSSVGPTPPLALAIGHPICGQLRATRRIADEQHEFKITRASHGRGA